MARFCVDCRGGAAEVRCDDIHAIRFISLAPMASSHSHDVETLIHHVRVAPCDAIDRGRWQIAQDGTNADGFQIQLLQQ